MTCRPDFHNSILEHLGTYQTLEVWRQPIANVNNVLMADTETEIMPCGNFF